VASVAPETVGGGGAAEAPVAPETGKCAPKIL